MESMLTLNEIAEKWSVSYSLVFSLVRQGKLEACRIGSAWRVSPAAVTAYEQANKYTVPQSKHQHRRIVRRITDD